MTAGNTTHEGRITRLYKGLMNLYTELPYRFSRGAYSLPTFHYYFEITRRCNLRCKMCQYIDWLEKVPARIQAEGELTTREWFNVIDQTGRFSFITFTGGEVFVRKDFMEIFEYACSKRRVHFISNATMLTDERAKRCVELAPRRLGGRGFNFAGVSLDGTQETHDVIRAQRGAFDKSFRGIKAIAKYREDAGKPVPLIHINTVIMRDNLHCLPDMPGVARDAGAQVLNLLTETRVHDIPELGRIDPGTITREDFKQPRIERADLEEALGRTLENAKRVGIEVRMPRMPFEEVVNHYDQGYDLKKFDCRAIWSTLIVGAKGGVYPCWIQKVGNVRENTLKELRNNEIMRRFRQRRREGGFAACRGCCEIIYRGEAHARGSEPVPVSKVSTQSEDPTGTCAVK